MDTALLRAFLDDCKAHPFDETPRLILADWLEEHGDTDADRARGVFLRLQVRAGVLPEYDLGGRASRLQSDDLERQYRDAWLGQLADDRFAWVGLARGLVRVTVRAARLVELAAEGVCANPAWDWVETVRLTGEGEEFPASVWDLPALESVGHLQFEMPADAPRDWARPLFASPYLRRLASLTGQGKLTSITNQAALIAWGGLATLQSLTLRKGYLGDYGVSGLLWSSGLSELRRLELSSADLTATSLRNLGNCPRLEKLELLNLSFNRLDDLTSGSFGGLVFAPNLRGLILNGCSLRPDGVRALASTDFPALTALGLGSEGLPPRTAHLLAQAPWIPQLENLVLADNQLRGGAPELLAAPLSNLRVLRLGVCGLDAEAIATLASSPHLGRLEELHLRNNPLGVAGAEVLRRSRGLGGLRYLDVSETGLGDTGATALAGWPGLAHLTHLIARACELTDTGLRTLIHSPHLSEHTILELHDNQPSLGMNNHVRDLGRPIFL